MARKKISTTIYITPEQNERLKGVSRMESLEIILDHEPDYGRAHYPARVRTAAMARAGELVIDADD